MPERKSINKVARSAERKRLRNRSVQSAVKTRITKAEKLIVQRGDSAQEEVVAAISSIDKVVNKGIFHQNKGARLKSRLMKKLNLVVASPSLGCSEGEAKQSQESEG